MACDMLQAVNNEKETWKVKVRVIRLWVAINPNSNELISLDMILIDEEVSITVLLTNNVDIYICLLTYIIY